MRNRACYNLRVLLYPNTHYHITVNLPRHPLRINVGFLLNAPLGYSRDIHFDFPTIRFEQDEYAGLNGTARVNRTPQGVLAVCEFDAAVTLECVRCLKAFDLPLRSEFSDLFAFDKRSMTDSELLIPDDGNIDLEPLVREYLLIEIPISPVCRPDCKGLCIECGEDLNLGTCEHNVRVIY